MWTACCKFNSILTKEFGVGHIKWHVLNSRQLETTCISMFWVNWPFKKILSSSLLSFPQHSNDVGNETQFLFRCNKSCINLYLSVPLYRLMIWAVYQRAVMCNHTSPSAHSPAAPLLKITLSLISFFFSFLCWGIILLTDSYCRGWKLSHHQGARRDFLISAPDTSSIQPILNMKWCSWVKQPIITLLETDATSCGIKGDNEKKAIWCGGVWWKAWNKAVCY